MNSGALAKTLLSPSLATAVLLIFGGCCSNVYTLESITHVVPDSGSVVTFAQFLGVSIGGFLLFSISHQGRQAIWHHKVPLMEFCKIVGFHFSVSILNNMALAYHISVPVHIILRSGGSMVTMLLGYLFFHRSYTYRQIAAVLLVTLGVIVSTTAGRGSGTASPEQTRDYSTFISGVLLMVLSQFLASGTGLYLERTFRIYAPSWRETLFWTHLLALPFFVPFWPTIASQFRALSESPPFFAEYSSIPFLPYNPPALVVHLFLNVITQLICVCGVNQLASTSTALSVSIVLNLRKFTSLVISFVIFGHRIDIGVVTGAVLVFIGAFWYSREPGNTLTKQEIKGSSVDLHAMDLQNTGERAVTQSPMLENGGFDEKFRTNRRPSLLSKNSEG